MIYSRDHLENIADDVNKNFFPQRLSSPSPLDSYDLLEVIGCDYEWKYISPDDSIMGMTFFDDGYWHIWPNGTYSVGDKPSVEIFRKGTVIINQRLLDSKSKTDHCRERFIVAHEAAHWIKDKCFFESHPDSILQTCYKNDFEKTFWSNSLPELEIIERQANYLGAAIHMPKKTITEAFFKAGRYRHIPDKPIEFKGYMRAWIAEIAQKFEINFNPIKYRLKDLNIIYEAK